MEPVKTIGTILEVEQPRDCIHVAIASVVAAHSLRPGDHIGLNEAGEADNEAAPIGIVDPFLKTAVKRGQRIWLFVYPGTIASLRHEWIHPSFSKEPTRISHDSHKLKSVSWIAEHAAELGLTADVLMEDADYWLEREEHRVQQGSERWRDNFNPTEFWHHYEIVTGKPVSEDKKGSFYCCTC